MAGQGQVTLLASLQHGLPEPSIRDDVDKQNTQSKSYRYSDMREVHRWQDFNVTEVRNRFGNALSNCVLLKEANKAGFGNSKSGGLYWDRFILWDAISTSDGK